MTVKINLRQLGEDQWKRMEKMPADLFHHLYGAIVVDIWRQCAGDAVKTNKRLDAMGYSMGTRLIEEICARCPTLSPMLCSGSSWKDAGEALAKVMFKMYMNANPSVIFPPESDLMEMIISLPNNEEASSAITKNVQLPDEARNSSFNYLQVYCGIIRGALESVYWKCQVHILKDVLKGDAQTEILVKFIGRLDEERPPEDDD
jgi:hypothetical protein